MKEAWIIIGIFAAAFVLWLLTGGPDRPISFAGPYLMPITNIGDVRESDGSGAPEAGGGSPSWETVSPYRGQVEIMRGASDPGAADIGREQITIRAARGPADTNVTGWQVVSVESGARAIIPQAAIIAAEPGVVDVMLRPYDEVVIITGHSPIGGSFRENACIEALIGGQSTAEDRLEYEECVRARMHEEDFYGNTWRIYLGRDTGLWRTRNETIRLLDREGRPVDVYAY